MTRGRQMPVHSKVRRRLVFEDEPDSADSETEFKGVDYLSEARSEFAAKELEHEMILKGMKWNFNFEKEVAYDGPLQWFRKGYAGEWEEMETAKRPVNLRKRKQEPENSVQVTCEDNSKVRKLPVEQIEDKMQSYDSEEIYLTKNARIYKSASDVQLDKLNEIGAKNEVTPRVSKDSNPPGRRAKVVKEHVLSERARRRICFE